MENPRLGDEAQLVPRVQQARPRRWEEIIFAALIPANARYPMQ
jgi:hypothetical protein